MNINDAQLMIKACVLADDRLLMEGLHGIGKSSIVKQFAKEENYHLEELFLSSQEIGDLIGRPDDEIIDGSRVMTWSKPIWLKRLEDNANKGINSILHLDEFNRAEQDVRQAALELILEGKIHEHQLPIVNNQRTMIVASINPNDGYQVFDLDPALLDRFQYITIEPDIETTLNYFRENNIHDAICDFLIEHEELLHWTPKTNIGSSSYNYGSSPRSWFKLDGYLKNIDKINKSIHYAMIKGKLGTEIASQFYQFFNNYKNNFKLDDVIKHIEKMTKETTDIEKIGNSIKELMKNMEPIVFNDYAKRLIKMYGSSNNQLVLLCFLYAVRIEQLIPILKELKETNTESYINLSKLDELLNEKKLFLNIYNKSKT